MLRNIPLLLVSLLSLIGFVTLWETPSSFDRVDQTDPAGQTGQTVQQVRLASNHSIERQHRQLYVDGDLFSGMMLDDDGSELVVYTRYEAGLKNGEEIGFYPTGQKAFRRSWINGNRDGETVFWWSNGRMKSMSTYSNDVLSGVHSEWFADGQMVKQFTYAQGQEEGPQKMWYEDGSIRANYVVKDGKRYGSIGAKGCDLDDVDGERDV